MSLLFAQICIVLDTAHPLVGFFILSNQDARIESSPL